MKTALSAIVLLLSITISVAQKSKTTSALTKQWETAPGLKIPESVLFDVTSGDIYVANIDGNSSAKDGNGFIAKLSKDGTIIKADWVTGLDAPKGMGILKNHLFVSNINDVVEIDIPTATIMKRYPVEGSKFLNDIAIDIKTGNIFISDSGNGQVYILKNGIVSLWLQGPMFQGANGLCIQGKYIYIGAGKNILKAEMKNAKVEICIPNTGGVDGLFVTSDKKFIYSDWKGSVYLVSKNSKSEILLNTSSQKINAADFGIIVSKNMILIPTFGDNRVMGYTSPAIK